MVVVGAGGFTSTRIATVVANAFGLALQIPLLAIKKTEVENVQKLIPKLLKQKSGHYISASYSGEPNITKAKDK
jgi:tRNA A37 threonylcarbamoyladenosine modification protein TsaB